MAETIFLLRRRTEKLVPRVRIPHSPPGNMMLLKNGQGIVSKEIFEHYTQFEYSTIEPDVYSEVWRDWLTYSENKSLFGLDNFVYSDAIHGTRHAFDHFVLRHCRDRSILALKGEFQYHECTSGALAFEYIDHDIYYLERSRGTAALIISAPFSDFGCMHPMFDDLMDACYRNDIPVCLDLAYWGIARNIHIDLARYPAIEEVVCSLSKPFYVLANHRVGIRFSRKYANDGISMTNEANMQNMYSMGLAAHFMRHFSPDWAWKTYEDRYYDVCAAEDLVFTDTVIFGLGDNVRHSNYNRGVSGNYRVCVSKLLGVDPEFRLT